MVTTFKFGEVAGAAARRGSWLLELAGTAA
jgi:hypothetical protein